MTTRQKAKRTILTFHGVDAARMLFGLGRYARALAILQKVLTRNPRNRDALLLMAAVLSHKGRVKEALNIVQSVLAEGPRDYEALLSKAEICSLCDQNEEALRLFARLGRRKTIPSKERRYLYAAWLATLIGAKRWRVATRVLHGAIREFPRDRGFLSYSGIIARRLAGAERSLCAPGRKSAILRTLPARWILS